VADGGVQFILPGLALGDECLYLIAVEPDGIVVDIAVGAWDMLAPTLGAGVEAAIHGAEWPPIAAGTENQTGLGRHLLLGLGQPAADLVKVAG